MLSVPLGSKAAAELSGGCREDAGFWVAKSPAAFIQLHTSFMVTELLPRAEPAASCCAPRGCLQHTKMA